MVSVSSGVVLMGLDHSCLTINVVFIEKFKARTMRNVMAKYAEDPKPLFVVNKMKGVLYLGGKEVASVSRNAPYTSFHFNVLQVENKPEPYGGHFFRHPQQTMEAIEGFEAICPAFATWLVFNLDALFSP